MTRFVVGISVLLFSVWGCDKESQTKSRLQGDWTIKKLTVIDPFQYKYESSVNGSMGFADNQMNWQFRYAVGSMSDSSTMNLNFTIDGEFLRASNQDTLIDVKIIYLNRGKDCMLSFKDNQLNTLEFVLEQ